MELMADTRCALEAVERLQAKLKQKEEAETQEKLCLLKTVLQSPLFHHILSLQQAKRKAPAKVRRVTKSMSMLGGPCPAMATKPLSHSDSYTWAMENQRLSATRSFLGGGGSGSSMDSLDLSCPDLRQDGGLPVESQGLGFGIIGGRSTGVMVKTILPRGAAGQDKRLHSGDQILRIGDADLVGMNSEQVAQVLRNAGSKVKLLIARDVAKGNHLPSPVLSQDSVDSKLSDLNEDYEFSVQFTKNSLGLGFTITSYIGDLNSVYSAGVVVNSIVKGSTVDQDGRIHIGDTILSVDGASLQGCSEQRATDLLKRTGPMVRLGLLRKRVRLSHILPPAPPLQPLRHSHSFHGGNPYRAGLGKIQETGIRTLREISRRAAYADRRPRHESRNGEKLTADEAEDLRKRWQHAVGPRYDVVVCQIERFSATSGLGVSLEARVGHHYLCSVLPESPVGQTGQMFPGDEILEVNGIPLIRETHKEVVRILKGLSGRICLVCSRIRAPVLPDSDEDSDVQLTLKQLLVEFNDKLDQDCVIPRPTEAEDIIDKSSAPPVSSPLAMWERGAHALELEKGELGLGFSILDYQDPEDATKTVLVVRSLVPGGVADRDGRLLPGDRLMFVNDTDLEGSSLDYAVHVLKSTFYGPVRIGVAKPLPLELCGGLTPVSERGTQASCDDNESHTQVSLLAETDANSSTFHSDEASGSQTDYTVTEDQLRQRPSAMDNSGKRQAPPPAPHINFERTITVVRGNRSLGMQVSSLQDGSAMLVRSLAHGGSISQDGRLGPGDSILAINGEPTSQLSNARARAMLRRHSVLGPEISITYVPAHHVEEHRARLGLAPLASLTDDSASSPPTPSPEPPPGPGQAQSPVPIPPPAAVTLSVGAPLKSPLTPPDPAVSPAPDRSWRSPRPVHSQKRREGAKEVERAALRRDRSPVPVPTDEVDAGKEKEEFEEEEEVRCPTLLSWGQPRSVCLRRAQGQSLGISILGGRHMGRRLGGGQVTRGVFINHVAPGSPAARDGTLRTGDRILEVSGVDLRNASHEQAVEAIRRAGESVVFLVQTGLPRPQSPSLSNHERLSPSPQPSSQANKEETVSGLLLRSSPTNPFPPTPFKVPSPSANRIDGRSPISVTFPITAREKDQDDTSRKKMLQRYGSLSGKLHMIELEKSPQASGMGLTLTGNKDGSRARMSVYVAAIDPQGAAGLDGRIRVGDELLEINGQILYGRSHHNASTLINNTASEVKIILIRKKTGLNQMAQRPRAEEDHAVYSQTDSVTETETDGGLFSHIQHIVLPQDHVGLGIRLAEEESRGGVVVQALSQHGTASKDGRIQVGDRVVAVCGQPVAGFTAEKVASLIQNHRASVKLSVSHPTPSSSASASLPLPTSSSYPFSISSASLPLASPTSSTCLSPAGTSPVGPRCSTPDPLSCPIVPGKESTVEIHKGSTSLGLSIVGGCDTLLGAVIIHEVNNGGAAQRDGRLLAGDQILEVNGIDLRQATHEEAIGVLRLTTQRVLLRVFRHQETPSREEELWDVFSLDLRPRPGHGLGLATVGKSNDTGIFVSEIIRGGVADKDGRLLLGDQILSINGEDVRAATQEHAEKLLKNISGTVHLEVARFKAVLPYSQGNQSEDSDCSTLTHSSGCDTSLAQQRETDSMACSYVFEEDHDIRRVALHKQGASGSLGIGMAGGVGSPHGDIPLFIASMDTDGPAAKTHQLQAGDRILSINGVPTDGMSHAHAGALLRNATGVITLEVTAGHGECGRHSISAGTAPPSGILSSHPSFHNNLCARAYKTISLERGASGLGFSVVGGFGSPHGDLPIYIQTVFNKGAAVEEGRLKRGDQIIAVNGHRLEGATHGEAVDVLKKTKGAVVLTVLSS